MANIYLYSALLIEHMILGASTEALIYIYFLRVACLQVPTNRFFSHSQDQYNT